MTPILSMLSLFLDSFIDPLGRPTVTADSDNYFNTHVCAAICPELFKITQLKQNTSQVKLMFAIDV